jgi:hypothetical protein
MLARVVSIKVALALVTVALGAATAFATTTGGDHAQPEAAANRQPIHSERGDGNETGERGNAPAGAAEESAEVDNHGRPPHAETPSDEAGNAAATGPDATGPAMSGLCQAFAKTSEPANASNKQGSVAYRNLAEAAAAAGQSVADFCEDATAPSHGEERDSSNGSADSRPSDIPPTGTAHDTDPSDSHGPDSPPESPESVRSSRP